MAGRPQNREGSTTVCSFDFSLAAFRAVIVPGSGPGVFISFLPPCDNSGHCLHAHSQPACWTLSSIVSFHHHAHPGSLGESKACPLVARLLPAWGRHPLHQPRTLRKVPHLGRDVFLGASWDPANLPVTLSGLLGTGCPGPPHFWGHPPHAAGLPSGKPRRCFSKPGLTPTGPRLPSCGPQGLSPLSHHLESREKKKNTHKPNTLISP